MLTISIEAYCVYVVVIIKPIYLRKYVFLRVSLPFQRKTIIFNCEENVYWKGNFKKVCVVKNWLTNSFKEYVKLLKY